MCNQDFVSFDTLKVQNFCLTIINNQSNSAKYGNFSIILQPQTELQL